MADVSSEKTELRVNVSPELMQRLDAVVQSKGLGARGDWVIPVLEAAVERELHNATLLLRMCRVNPLASES